ncbi:efflux RND transporter periplasmic adaptor subunit [Ramlibacter sp. MMS24-I3-19]|uniref:efflux RND transporter periplasmic adaptor subunit n=1 Tax=Ramlibacter sp. MMS24-I3-19 TaxID=3416606 RepID=UPI003D07FA95
MDRGKLMVALLAASLLVAGCNRQAEGKAASGRAPAPLLVGPEDVLVLRPGALVSGPLITGTLQPERRADLRAEVSAVVTAVAKENGDTVRKGDLLVRLDDTAIRDALMSAQEAERAGRQAYEQAERQLQRLTTLRASGMASAQQLEDAEVRRNTTQSDYASARARTVQARQQLQRTEVRAPFDGIVAERKLSVGDTAQVGKELLKVMDPRTLRLEGLVSSDAIQSVQRGQPVTFRVNGFGEREFAGTVRLVSPAANPTTRQVEVLVDVEGALPRMAGLYAQGRITTASGTALTLSPGALVRVGESAWAWRIADGKLQKVAVSLGDRDPRSGEYVVRSGLAAGDRLLRSPLATLHDGQPVQEPQSGVAGVPASIPVR